MTKIIRRNLPNAIAFADVADVVVRGKIAALVANINSLKSQLSEAQTAIEELQRR